MPLVEDIQIFSLNPDLIVTKEDHMCMRLAKSLWLTCTNIYDNN